MSQLNLVNSSGKAVNLAVSVGQDEASKTINIDSLLSADNFLHIQDQKATGTDAGNNLAGANTRVLNTVLTNTISGASLASNQITLPIGKYYVEASAPAYDCNNHVLELLNFSDTLIMLVGQGLFCEPNANAHSLSKLNGVIDIATSKVIELKHTIQTATTHGLGKASGQGSLEVYTDVKIWKVG